MLTSTIQPGLRAAKRASGPGASLAAGLAILLALAAAPARAGMGQNQIPGADGDGPVTLFYPTAAPDQVVQRGRLTLHWASQAAPERGNGRLVVISHGSGGSPWVHADLARQLVAAGFVVAMPEHRADNYRDPSRPGPDSWARRPAEVSRAIDAVGRDAGLAPLLALDKVGVYGMSAGGHTALSLAGGRWSRAGFARHCQAHLAEDFQTCVGLVTQLTGGPLDGLKLWAARTVIGLKFDDDAPQSHHDARVAAVVAGVPLAADFDLPSLAQPPVPLALVTARQDRWLIPAFHSDAVLAVCRTCELLPDGGHGALLLPLPPGFIGLAAALLNDPPGFDRRQLPALDQRIAAYFSRHLLR